MSTKRNLDERRHSKISISMEDSFDFILSTAGEVLKLTLIALKKPLSLVLSGYILALIASYSATFFFASLHQFISPICNVPLINLLPIPWCGGVNDPDYSDLLDLQARFEAVLQNTVGGSSLAVDLKNSEIAIRDLNSLVKTSDLNSKEQLSFSIDEFVSGAKSASRDLHKLNSGVGGAVDAILAMDQYALRSLEIAERQQSESPRSLAAYIVYPFSLLNSPRRKVVDTYNQAAAIMETNLRRLIMEAEGSIIILNHLDNQLDVINDIVSRETKDLKFQTDEVLAQLWSLLGGNRQKLGNFASHRSLLSNISTYRTRALAHVSATLMHLQQLSADLDELRDRVASPVLLGTDVIPLEVHIETIRKGIDRLTEGRSKSKIEEKEILQRMVGGTEGRKLVS